MLSIDLVVVAYIRERLAAYRAARAARAAERRARAILDAPCPLDPEPRDCPGCSGRVALDGALWRCQGLRDRTEVERHLGRGAPPHVLFRPPCGWAGAAEEYGRMWA